MNDKLQKLYELYKQKGIINTTDFNTFAAANNAQRQKLYDLGVQKGLFNTTDFNTFNNAWGGAQQEPLKKKEPTASASKLAQPTSGSSSRRFEGVTEEPISQKKVRTEDYLDIVQNAQKKPKVTTQKVESTFEQPKETKPPVKFDALSEKEAMQMMAEDFGKKEFEAYSSIEKIPSANKLKDLDEETTANILNKQFEGTNLEFKKLGWQLTVTSKIGDGINSTIINEKTIDLSDPNADKQLKSFVSNNLVKKSEREQFENAQSVEDLVELVGSNPNKFNASILEGMDTDRYFERQMQILEGEMARAKADTYDADLKSYEQAVIKFNQEVKSGKMSKADFDERVSQLEDQRNLLQQRQAIIVNSIKKANNIDKLSNNLLKANIISKEEREKQGSFLGNIGRGYGEGLTDTPQNTIDFAATIASAFTDAKTFANTMAPGEYDRLKRLGYTDDEIKNEIQKSIKNRAIKVLKSVPDAFSLGTTEEYSKSSDRSILDQALYAIAESTGAAMGGVGLMPSSAGVTAGFFAMSYNALEDQMRGPQFDALTENEKKIMSVPYGLVIGQLEKLGLKVATSAAKSKTLSMFSQYILSKTFTSLPRNATILEIKSAIDKNIAASVANGMIKITGAGLVEGGTEFTQQIFEGVEKDVANRIIQSNQLDAAKEEGGGTVSKEIYDKIVENKFFKDAADLTTSEGISDLLNQSANAFAVGALAGGLGGGFSVGIAQPIANKISNNKFAIYRDVILNDPARAGAISSINQKVDNQEITREEADKQINDINESYSALRQIPSSFSLSSQREAFGLLREKDKLQKEIEGKDPSLVAKQKDRIAEIETQLKGLSYAVQEQSTDEVSIQPTTGVGEEVEGGTPESKTEGTTGEVVGEETQIEQAKAKLTEENSKGQIDVNEIEARRQAAENKLREEGVDNLFIGANLPTGSKEKSVPVSVDVVDGITVASYANEKTGLIDSVISGFGDNNFVGYYRIYENGNPTNKWSSKFENQKTENEEINSTLKDKFKTMISSVQQRLPSDHKYTEKTSISTDGLRIWGNQIDRGTYEVELDENGKIITDRVAINGDALVNELGVDVNQGAFESIKIGTKKEFEKVKQALLPYLQKLGLNENNIHWNGPVPGGGKTNVYIDLPVLSPKVQAAPAAEPVVTEVAVTPEIDPNEKFTFAEDKVPAELKGVEPIGRTETGKKGFLGIRRGKPTVTLTYSGQQLIDAGINKSTIQNEKRTETSERAEAQARPENDGRADQAVRENAKRENVKTSIQRLRDQGLLVTAKAKGGKMTDAEINAFMALSDAMAKVWKQTTGQDNFYDTFIDQVKQGDLNAIKEKGGVLFQNIEIPQRPISRVTLAVFELPEFKQMIGKEVSVEQVRNMIKSRGKQIEKDIINEVLSYDKYQEKKMMFDVFRNDVEIQLMKLEPITTATYATYGMDNLGKDQEYGNAETIVFNTPVDHGYTGHFGSDFSYGNLGSSTRWEVRQLPGVNQYVAIDADMPSGLAQDQIVEYVGTAGSKESVEKWIEKRKDILSDELNVGLFGHIRSWFNKGTGVFTLAEAQSDWFQKKKPADIFSSELTEEKNAEIRAKAKKAAEAEIEKLANNLGELNKSVSERYGLSVDLKKETGDGYYELIATVKDSNGDILLKDARTFIEDAPHGIYNEQELTTSALIGAISEIRDDTTGKYNALLLNKAKEFKDIKEQELKDIDTILDFDAETNYFSSDEKGIILSDLERNQFRWEEASRNTRNLKEFQNAQENIDRLENILKLLRANSFDFDVYLSHGRKVIHQDVRFINGELNTSDYDRGNELSKQRKIAENNAIEEIKNSKKGDLILQQFFASAKVHELRLMRESFKHAAKKGAKELWFPTPYTLAVIEGYVDSDANGTGNAPYEIIDSRYTDELQQGDTIRYEGDSHIVLDSDSSTITVADLDYVQTYDRDEFIHSEAYDYYGDELRRDFENQFGDGIDRDDFESGAYKSNETYSYIVEREMQNWFNSNPDEDILFWDGISDDIIVQIEDHLSLISNEDLFGGYGNIYEGSYSTVYVVESNREFELLQPDQYEEATTEEEGWEDNLADNQKTVVNKYKELNKVFEKLRPDTQLKVDDNGRTWLSTNITAEDLMNPVIAFQNEGAKVKGAVDFSNDNKASIYLFDGADISTLAHEVSGHVGRRMLAKLAETDKGFRKDYEAAMKWAGAKDGEWSVAAEEKFARGFERYLQTGKAPFEELRTVFERLRTWLTNIYKQIRGSSIDVKLTPEITKVFDNLLRVKTKEKPMAEKKKNSVMAIVKEGKEQGKTDDEIRKDAMDAGFGAKEAANALATYYAQGEGIFTRSGKTGVTTRLYEGAKKYAQQYLTSKGLMPKIGFNLKERMEGEISKEANRAVNTAKKFGKLFDKTKEDKELLLKDFDSYLRGNELLRPLPKEFIGIANEMRNHIDTLSQMLINNGAVTGEMADTIKQNLGSYLSRSYEIYDNKNYRKKVRDELVNQARNFLRTQPGTILEAKADATKRGIPLNQAIEGILDNKINDLFAEVKNEGFFKGSKVGAKDLSTLKFRQDIPEQIRMLMGEYTDPAMNYARTVNKLIHLAAQHKFLSDVRESGFGKFFFEKGDSLRPAGYNTEIAAEGSEVMAPLNGLYTTPEIFEAFQKQFNPKEIGRVMTFLYRVMSITKWSKTIASLATHFKNIFGNSAFVMSNGHDITKLGNAIKIVANDLRTMSKPEVQAKIDEYIEAGIMRQGAGINEIRDMFKDASLDGYLEKRLSAKKPRSLFGKAGKYLASFTNKVVRGLEDLYQAEDDMFKIAAYENEVARYADSWYNKKPADLTAAEKKIVSEKAANNVKDTYPTYSRIPEGIKLLRKFPLFIGSFISFQAEAYRTAFNTIALAKEELSSDNKKLKKIGATRIAGATAYLTIKTAFLSYFGMAFGTGLSGVIGYFSDDDDEKEKEKDVREFLPPWSKNSDLIIKKKADGTIDYIDFSASDAHGGFNKALNAFFSGEDLLDGFSKGLLATVEPFVGPDITVGLAIQLYNNENDFGGKIYNEQDTFAEKTRKIRDYVYKVIQPGTASSIEKLLKEEDTKNVIIGELTGMKIRPLEVKKQFEFKMDTYADDFAEIKRIYNSEYNKTLRMMEDPKVTKKELEEQKKITEEAFNRANSLYAAKGKELMNLINAANRLGVDYDQLIEAAKAKSVMNQTNLLEIQQGYPAKIEEKPY